MAIFDRKLHHKKWILLIIFSLSLIGIISIMPHGKSAAPYDIIKTPCDNTNGFGFNSVKVVNWTYFKNMFQSHTNWIFEYKRYSSSVWTNGSSYLTIQKTWIDTYWKFKLILDVPVNIYSARFTFSITISCLQYVNHSGTEIWINYTANKTEIYPCLFNYSDIINIPGIVTNRGKTNNMMWMSFKKDNINAGHYEFDPFFGLSGIGIVTANTENIISVNMNYYNAVPTWSVAYKIYVYLGVTLSTHKVSCALYDYNNILIAVTEQKNIIVSTRWNQFNFTNGILLDPSKQYKISCWSNSTNGNCNIYRSFSPYTYFQSQAITYNYPNFPNPFDPHLNDSFVMSIYVPYFYLNMNSLGPYPVNSSIAHTNITLSSYCSAHNGSKFNFSLYKMNNAGTYYLDYSLIGTTNNTFYSRWFNATSVGHIYYWKISLKNYTLPFWINYTYHFTLIFHNNTLTLVNNIVNTSGVHQYKWDNTSGFTSYSNYTTEYGKTINVINSSGTTQYRYNSSTGKFWTWINYTTGIGKTYKILNATGTTQYRYNSTTGKFWVWANYTGYNSLTFVNHYINSTGTHQTKWMGTYWIIYDNNTGNTTPITLYQNPVNSTGTHTYVLKSTGYKVYANYTGLNEVDLYDNTINATGTLTKRWYGTYWKVWANYTGNASSCPICNSTNLTLYENILNATGTHDSSYNHTTGWFVWANYTGNLTIVPLSNFTMELNFTGFPIHINWTGDYVSNQTNITFNVTSNMSLNGNVTAKNSDDWLYIAGFDINPTFLLLSVFFGLLYLWWKSEKVSMMFVLAMIIVPYDFVVMIVYLLPHYITDVNILLFIRVVFMLISLVVMGYTVDYRSKKKKEEKQSGE
jgi:hypothetical protein